MRGGCCPDCAAVCEPSFPLPTNIGHPHTWSPTQWHPHTHTHAYSLSSHADLRLVLPVVSFLWGDHNPGIPAGNPVLAKRIVHMLHHAFPSALRFTKTAKVRCGPTFACCYMSRQKLGVGGAPVKTVTAWTLQGVFS